MWNANKYIEHEVGVIITVFLVDFSYSRGQKKYTSSENVRAQLFSGFILRCREGLQQIAISCNMIILPG